MKIILFTSLVLTWCAGILSGTLTAQTPAGEKKLPDEPELVWKFKGVAPLLSTPVIQGDTLFFGASDGYFRALDLKNGKLFWQFKTDGEIRSAATLHCNCIYFTSDGKLYCLDRQGIPLWIFTMRPQKKYDFADYFHSSPVISNNIVFIGSGDGFIYAVRAEDGTMLWEFSTGDVVHGTPVTDGNYLYAGSFDGYVYKLSLPDGSLEWKFKTLGHRYFPTGEVQGSPTQTDDLIIVGARDYNVYALDKRRGYCHWNKSFARGWVLSNTCRDTALYMAGADERILLCVEPATGREYWSKSMEFLMFGQPAFDEEHLYIGTTIGKMHAVDRATGQTIWTYQTDGYKLNRSRYFKPDDSYRDDIYSLIKSNEQFLEVEYELGGIFSGPAVSGEYLVFNSADGTVYCLRHKKISKAAPADLGK